MHPGTFSIHIISLDQTNGYINSMMQCQLNMAFSPSLFCNTKIHLFFNYGHFIQAKALQNKRSEIVLNCFNVKIQNIKLVFSLLLFQTTVRHFRVFHLLEKDEKISVSFMCVC